MKHLQLFLWAMLLSTSLFALSPISGPSAVCATDTIALTDASPGGTWSSSNPSVASIGSATGALAGVTAGVVTITYTVGASSVTYPVTVNALPTAFSVTGDGIICSGGPGTDIGLDGSQPGTTYQVYHNGAAIGGPLAGTGSALDFGFFPYAGYYTIVAMNPATGCVSEMSGSVAATILPTVVPTVSVTGGLTVCTGAAVVLTAATVNGGPAPAYQWQVNGVNVGTTSAYAYTPANGDVVVVTMASNAICAAPAMVADTVTMNVLPMVTPAVSITASPGTVITPGETVTFTAAVTNGGPSPSFMWMVNGTYVSGATTATYTTSSLANGDVVKCIVTSNALCRASSTATGSVGISIAPSGLQNISGAFTNLQVLPNPGKGTFVIRGTLSSVPGNDKLSVELTDITGQVVYSSSAAVTSAKIEIPVILNSGLTSGIYLLQVSAGGARAVMKVMVER